MAESVNLQPPTVWPERHARLLHEQQTRPERLRRLKALVGELFPGDRLQLIRDKIETSFDVPQAGQHHNEGVFMDTHLERIFSALERLKDGQFPPLIPPEIQAMLTRVVSVPENRDLLRRYVLLHDIDKANTLNVTYKDGVKRQVSWKGWQEMIPGEAKASPVAMQHFFNEQGIVSIGYYGHEKAGAATVGPQAAGLKISPVVVKAIEKHGVAYNFDQLRLDTFQAHFGELSREAVEWVVTASYVDSTASLGLDGQPELGEFLNMCGAIHNTFLIKEFEEKYVTGAQGLSGLDDRKVRKWLKQLRDTKSQITLSLNELLEKALSECQFTLYNREQLKVQLAAIPHTPETALLTSLQEEILSVVDPATGRLDESTLQSLRSQLGRANQYLVAALAQSEVKPS